METRVFGATGDQVTVLGYGAMEFRHTTDAQAKRLLNAALDAGINFIDTAPDYGPSEDMIGKYIAHRRSEYFLATKCGCDIPPSGNPRVQRRHLYTGQQLRHNIEHSLKRLKTDYIDVWQVHSAYPEQLQNTDVLETMHQIQGIRAGSPYCREYGWTDTRLWLHAIPWIPPTRMAHLRCNAGLVFRLGPT
jgi:aryl-alcohol dehydrogenase-like predicted oxidoreductase